MKNKVRFVSTPQTPKAYKNSVRMVSLSGYQSPEVIEDDRKDWVLYTTGDDGQDYFESLIEKYLGSPTNACCINGITEMIYGRGLDALDSRDNPEMYAKMKMLLKPSCMRKLVNDYKLLGQGALQVIYNKTKTKIVKVTHFPMETLRAEKAKSGKCEAYYYHPKWAELKPSDKPKRIPTFGNGSKSEAIELYIFKPYKSGFYYYAPVDYNGCIQYAELEEEVANYHLNNIQNGLQPSLMINFNNGIPNEETQELLERRIAEKFGGSGGTKFVLQFNDSSEDATTIEPIHLPDAHAQYQFLADESREKIMLGHRIVSPILLGIKDNTGFGNNAEELRTASIIMDNMVIRPFQQQIIDGLNEILAFNNIHLQLYFITLQPIEFTELENIETRVKREEETGEKLSSQVPEEVQDLSDEEFEDIFDQLESLGEVISDDWELVSSEKVDLASVSDSDAKPSKSSSQDNKGYKVRYAYMPMRKSADSRLFCQKMEAITEKEIVFRLEDINMMSFRGVNKELGHKGRNYSLFKFKGGKNCHHFWEKRVYKKKTQVSEDEALADGYKAPNNPEEVPVAPRNMPNGGAYPTTK
jgi:hypothetical protein